MPYQNYQNFNVSLSDSNEQIYKSLIGRTNIYSIFNDAINDIGITNSLSNKEELQQLFDEAFKEVIKQNNEFNIGALEIHGMRKDSIVGRSFSQIQKERQRYYIEHAVLRADGSAPVELRAVNVIQFQTE